MSNKPSPTAAPDDLKFYSKRGVLIATFLGGPLSAGYLIRANYLKLNQPKQGLIALIIGIIVTITMFAVIFSLPESVVDTMPSMIIPMTYLIGTYFIIEKIHGHILDKHEKDGKPFYSNWRAAAIGLLSTIIMVIGIVASVYLMPQSNNSLDPYDAEMAKFTENEAQTLTIFDRLDDGDSAALVDELDTQVIPKWRENIAIIERTNQIEGLSPELIEQNAKLLEYSHSRLESFMILRKMIHEDDQSYLPVFKSINNTLERQIEELKEKE